MMAAAVECLDLRASLCHSRSRPRPSSRDLGGSRVRLAPGIPGLGPPGIPGTPGTPPRVIATNPCDATAGMEIGDHCMIPNDSCHRVPDDRRCSFLVMAHL